MLKKVLVLLVLLVCVSSFAKTSAPFRFSLVPGFGWPKKDVVGLNLGIIGDQEQGKSVAGTDWSLFVSLTENIKGNQCSIVNVSKNSVGDQGGFVNVTSGSKGCQWGFINFAKDNTEGLQIGFINIMDNGWLPFFIIFNFSK